MLTREGGTTGDIESAPFIHAVSQLQRRVGRGNFVQILVSYVPIVGEQKTKPTQRAVSDSRSAGLSPDLACVMHPFAEPLLTAFRSRVGASSL
jgi:CTP synthase (UTP-ammonia lyase)